MSRFTNNDGLVQYYGARAATDDAILGVKLPTRGAVQALRFDFAYNQLPGFDWDTGGGATPDAFSNAVSFIPAGSVIVNCYLTAKTAWTGTATLDIGFYKKDGTAIDVDGLIDGIDVDDADVGLGAIGISQRANGVTVQNTSGTFDPDWLDTASATASNLYVKAINVSGTLTAGTAILVVEYIPTT